MVLETAKATQLQSKDVVVDQKGNFTVSLNLFSDTIESYVLPQRLMVYITKGHDDYLPICIAVIRDFVQLENPKYTVCKDRPLIYWRKNLENGLVNKRLEITSLNDHSVPPVKYQLRKTITLKDKADNPCEGLELEKPLSGGIYYVDATEDVEFSFFDDEEQVMPIYDTQRILCVNGGQVLNQFFAGESNSIVDWLAAATIALYKENWIHVLSERLRLRIEQGNMFFEPQTCSSLLFSLLLHCGDKSNLHPEIKKKAKEVCALINDFAITYTHRAEILKYLLESSISESDCQSIINDLQLYLFSSDGTVRIEKPHVQRMWEINDKIAILMNLRRCVSNASADIDRMIGRIGNDALHNIITFSLGTECKANDWYDCFELVLSEKCDCRHTSFECSKKVWGDASEYSKLFVRDKKGNYQRLVPDHNHTDGYELFGMNYLTLICKLIPENQDEEIKKSIQCAKKEMYKVDNLTHKYGPQVASLFFAIRARLGDNLNIESLFCAMGCASALMALAGGRAINVADLQELLPFWKHAMRAYPDLVYRDLIISELFLIFGQEERGADKCQ